MKASPDRAALRIAIFANVGEPPFVNNLSGPLRAFARLADVRLVEPRRFPSFVATGGARPAEVPEGAVRAALDTFLPDAVVCFGGGLFVPPTLRRLFPPGAVFAGFAASDPIGLEASLAIAPGFDLFFTQAPNTADAYRARGVSVGRCDPAVDTEQYRPLGKGKDTDVVYVGKWTPYRDAMVRALAERFSVKVFSYAGESRWSVPALPPLDTPEDLCLALDKSRVALECALVDEPAAGRFVGTARITNRPQMAAACGVPSLIEPFPELREFFEPGTEIETYADAVELVAKAQRLLADDERREAMGRRARERVLREHTWEKRLRGVVAEIAAASSRHQREGLWTQSPS